MIVRTRFISGSAGSDMGITMVSLTGRLIKFRLVFITKNLKTYTYRHPINYFSYVIPHGKYTAIV